MRSGRLFRENNEYTQNFDGEPLGKWVLARPRGSCEVDIKLEYRDIHCEDGRCVRLSQDFVQWQVIFFISISNQN